MGLFHPSRTWKRRILKAVLLLAFSFFLFISFRPFNFFGRGYDTWAWESCPNLTPFDNQCTASRASVAHDVRIVVKTGGSEPRGRIRSQLETIFSRVPPENIIVFSDLEEDIGSVHVHDVYQDISRQELESYPEFALYNELQTYKSLGKDTRELKGGWGLDKYKNLAIKRKIWQMMQQETSESRKDWKWFVFIDTDTFVDWDNIFAFLEHFDSREKLYFGSPVWLPDLSFAHGGSGYILSHGALESLNVLGDQVGPRSSQFGVNTTALCCGDEALARALKQNGMVLKGYWPMFNGEIPATVGFGPEIWCEPVLSLHHVSGTDMEDLWQWVENWRSLTIGKRPLLFEDLFDYIAPQIVTSMKDWDNTEEGWKIYIQDKNKPSPVTFEQCEAACEADTLCFQFVLHGDTCALSHTIRLGRKRLADEDGGEKYISGWNLRRIQDWTSKTKCTSAHWVHSNP